MTEPAPSPPLPLLDEMSRPFWEGVEDRKLMILRCNECGTYIHWPRPACRNCLSADLAPAEVSGKGTLYSWSVATQPFHPFYVDKVPYLFATIALAEQADLRIVSNLVDCSEADLRIDAPVEVVYRQVSPELTLPLFRLAS